MLWTTLPNQSFVFFPLFFFKYEKKPSSFSRTLLTYCSYDFFVLNKNYSLALYLARNYALALNVFRDFKKAPPPTFSEKDLMEMNLFEARMMEESGDLKGTLEFLQSITEGTNILAREEMSSHLELELGLFEQAENRFLFLVKDRNTENYDYHRGLQVSFSLSSLEKEKKIH